MAAKLVSCPHCGKKSEYSPENSFRPFCSERCQLLDLGDWASEKFAIPVHAMEEPELVPTSTEEKGSD
jgi:uncharacterized protein